MSSHGTWCKLLGCYICPYGLQSIGRLHCSSDSRQVPCTFLVAQNPVLLFLGLFENAKENFKNTKVRSGSGKPSPEGPRIEKLQSREAILKKSSFQYEMKFSIENGFFHSEPLSGRRKPGPGLTFSSENENFRPRMKISSENENFKPWGNDFFHVFERE